MIITVRYILFTILNVIRISSNRYSYRYGIIIINITDYNVYSDVQQQVSSILNL